MSAVFCACPRCGSTYALEVAVKYLTPAGWMRDEQGRICQRLRCICTHWQEIVDGAAPVLAPTDKGETHVVVERVGEVKLLEFQSATATRFILSPGGIVFNRTSSTRGRVMGASKLGWMLAAGEVERLEAMAVAAETKGAAE